MWAGQVGMSEKEKKKNHNKKSLHETNASVQIIENHEVRLSPQEKVGYVIYYTLTLVCLRCEIMHSQIYVWLN